MRRSVAGFAAARTLTRGNKNIGKKQGDDPENRDVPILVSSSRHPTPRGCHASRSQPEERRFPALFPAVEPHRGGVLELDRGHRMYWEESGNPGGVPVVFLHGGPGAGASPVHRQFFDPAHYRIVIFDQRGAGRSTPLGHLDGNTTQDLVGDMERLRGHLAIGRWIVFGGSWGSTLALAYAVHHPERCAALVLRGIFLGRPAEIDWFLTGIRNVFPETWREFAGYIPEAERADLLGAYHRRLVDPDPAVHLPAARRWSVYEGSCSTLLPNPALVADFASDRVALGLARIEAHYFVNRLFLAGRLPARERRPHPRHPRRHRAGTLRRGVPAGQRRTTCIAPGRRPSTTSWPMPGTPRSSRASARGSSPRWRG